MEFAAFVILFALAFTAQATKIDNYVVGGAEAVPHAHPYQAALEITQEKGKIFCAGALISTNYVLTAAHCLQTATSAAVTLGAHNLTDTTEGQTKLTARTFIIHEGYDEGTMLNDIGLIKLPSKVMLSENIQLISLPRYSDYDSTYAGRIGTLTGWGYKFNGAGLSDVLNVADIEVITNTLCDVDYLGYVHASNICTSGTGPVGACDGDSGSPLVFDYKLIGVVSYGSTFCESKRPTVYSRTSSYLDWISQNSDTLIVA